MCTREELGHIVEQIARTAQTVFGDALQAVILYGSYARGDYDAESDVDIMVLADVPKEKLYLYKKPFIEQTSALGLEYDTVITVNLKDTETFERYHQVLPFYRNVMKEGVAVGIG